MPLDLESENAAAILNAGSGNRVFDFIPAAARRIAVLVEISVLPGLGETDHGDAALAVIARRAGILFADQRDEIAHGGAGDGQDFCDAFGGRPARLAIRAEALAAVEGGGVEPRFFCKAGSGVSGYIRQPVNPAPDLFVLYHRTIIPLYAKKSNRNF